MLCLPGTDCPGREELLLALALLLVHEEADDVGLGNLVCVSNQNARNAPVIDQLISTLPAGSTNAAGFPFFGGYG